MEGKEGSGDSRALAWAASGTVPQMRSSGGATDLEREELSVRQVEMQV